MTLGNKGKVGKNKNSAGWKQLNNYWGSEQSIIDANKGRNRRNVWTITTKPFKDAHFATFPKDLIEPCIKAGCPEKVCVECGTPYSRNFKIITTPERETRNNMINVIPGRDKPTRMNSKNMESLIKENLGLKKIVIVKLINLKVV